MGDSGSNELVLLVEDDAPLRAILQRVLELHGYRAIAVGDGYAAIAAAAEHGTEIALYVCDAIIPGPSGAELIEQLGRHAPNARVLFMSGYSDHAVLRDSALASRLELLQKPFSASDFAAAVRRAIDHL